MDGGGGHHRAHWYALSVRLRLARGPRMFRHIKTSSFINPVLSYDRLFASKALGMYSGRSEAVALHATP